MYARLICSVFKTEPNQIHSIVVGCLLELLTEIKFYFLILVKNFFAFCK
jgi:hypothetical protein